jgi:hypothetical protein
MEMMGCANDERRVLTERISHVPGGMSMLQLPILAIGRRVCLVLHHAVVLLAIVVALVHGLVVPTIATLLLVLALFPLPLAIVLFAIVAGDGDKWMRSSKEGEFMLD